MEAMSTTEYLNLFLLSDKKTPPFLKGKTSFFSFTRNK